MRHNYGKIALSREIRGHWVYDDPVILKVWVSILLMANFKDGTLILGKSKYTIKRGQTAMSMRSWSHELKLGVKKLETIFTHFEEDGMIKRVTIGKGKQSTTLITVVKYNDFQVPTETLAKQYGVTIEAQGNQKGSENESQGADNIIKNNKDNNDNKDNKEDIGKPKAFSFFHSLKSLGVDENLINDWLKVRKTKKCVNTETAYNAFVKELDKTTLKPNEVVKICCEKSWGGFNFEWLKDVKDVKPTSNSSEIIFSGPIV